MFIVHQQLEDAEDRMEDQQRLARVTTAIMLLEVIKAQSLRAEQGTRVVSVTSREHIWCLHFHSGVERLSGKGEGAIGSGLRVGYSRQQCKGRVCGIRPRMFGPTLTCGSVLLCTQNRLCGRMSALRKRLRHNIQ